MYPEMGLRCVAESYYNLRKALDVHSVNAQMNLTQRAYRSDKFAIGLSTEAHRCTLQQP